MSGYTPVLKIIAVAAALLISVGLHALTDREQRIADRLAPVGSTCFAGEDCSSTSASAGGGAKDPESVYTTYCQACHASGVAGAPVLGDAAAWSERLDKGLEVVYSNAIGGIGGMPAKGACGDCSDDDIKQTIDYILAQSQ